jgi:hypothetical protein
MPSSVSCTATAGYLMHRTSHHVPTLVFLNTHPETPRYLALSEAWTVLPVFSDHMIHHSSRLWLTLRPEQANKHLVQCLSLFSVRRVQTPLHRGRGEGTQRRDVRWCSSTVRSPAPSPLLSPGGRQTTRTVPGGPTHAYRLLSWSTSATS